MDEIDAKRLHGVLFGDERQAGLVWTVADLSRSVTHLSETVSDLSSNVAVALDVREEVRGLRRYLSVGVAVLALIGIVALIFGSDAARGVVLQHVLDGGVRP